MTSSPAAPEAPPSAATTVVDRLYAALVEEEDARACLDISEDACRVVPRAFLANTTAQAMTSFGDAIINPKTTLPWLLTALSAPPAMAGLLVPLREAGSLLPQLAIAGWLRRLAKRKFAWMAGAALQGVAVLGIGIAALTTRGSLFGALLFALICVFSLARGVCSVASKDVLGKTVAKRRRGRVSGYASSIAGAGTLVVAALLWFLGDEHVPYLALLFGGGALWLLAIPVYQLIPEYAGATEGGANGLKHAIARMAVVVDDVQFRRLVAVRTLLLSTALLSPFLVVLAREHTGATLSLFLISQGLAGLVAGPIWGRFADVSSRRVLWRSAAGVAVVGAIAGLASASLPSLVNSMWFLPTCFFAVALLHDGIRLGRKTHVVDLAGGNRRTDYVAVGNTITGVALLLGGALVALVPVGITAKILVLSTFAAVGAVAAFSLAEVQSS